MGTLQDFLARKIIVHDGDVTAPGAASTVEAFWQANASLSLEELEEMKTVIDEGDTYIFGGGAAGISTVRYARPITLYDVARAKGAKVADDGSISMGEFVDRGVPFFCGCQHCGASLGAYNGHPTRNGFVTGSCCIEGDEEAGFMTFADYAEWEKAEAGAAIDQDADDDACTDPNGHKWVTTDDGSYHGEGRAYCEHCGADGDG